MLVVGVVLGVALGPAVLGTVAPDTYDTLFIGSGDRTTLVAAEAELNTFLTDADARQARVDKIIQNYQPIVESGESGKIARDEQITNLINSFADEQARLEAAIDAARVPILMNQQAHRKQLLGIATVIVLLIIVLLTVEAILSPQREEIKQGRAELSPALARLVTIRYGLAAGWLLLMLAQPVWLHAIDPAFGLILLAVVLIAGLVPLGKKAATS